MFSVMEVMKVELQSKVKSKVSNVEQKDHVLLNAMFNLSRLKNIIVLCEDCL